MKNNSFLACLVLTCLVALATGMTPDPSLDKSDFVSIAEAIPDVMLEVRYYSTYNFVGDRINGYEAPVSYLTKEAADAAVLMREIECSSQLSCTGIVNNSSLGAETTVDTRTSFPRERCVRPAPV